MIPLLICILVSRKNCTGLSHGGNNYFLVWNRQNIYSLFDCSFLGEVAIADDLLLPLLHTDIFEISSGFSRSCRTQHLNAHGDSHHGRGPPGSVSRQGRQQGSGRTSAMAGKLSSARHPQAAALSPAHLCRLLPWSEGSALAPAQLGNHSPAARLQLAMDVHIHTEEKERSSYRNGKKRNGFYAQVLNDICKCF